MLTIVSIIFSTSTIHSLSLLVVSCEDLLTSAVLSDWNLSWSRRLAPSSTTSTVWLEASFISFVLFWALLRFSWISLVISVWCSIESDVILVESAMSLTLALLFSILLESVLTSCCASSSCFAISLELSITWLATSVCSSADSFI